MYVTPENPADTLCVVTLDWDLWLINTLTQTAKGSPLQKAETETHYQSKMGSSHSTCCAYSHGLKLWKLVIFFKPCHSHNIAK